MGERAAAALSPPASALDEPEPEPEAAGAEGDPLVPVPVPEPLVAPVPFAPGAAAPTSSGGAYALGVVYSM